MSIRKISDLPQYSYADIGKINENNVPSMLKSLSGDNPDRLGGSLFEISEVQDDVGGLDDSRFSSRYITFRQLFKDITQNILYENTLFEGNKTFQNGDIYFRDPEGAFRVEYKDVQISSTNFDLTSENANIDIVNDFVISAGGDLCTISENTFISSVISSVICGGNGNRGGVYLSSFNDLILSARNDTNIYGETINISSTNDITISSSGGDIILSSNNDLCFMVNVGGQMHGAWLDKVTGQFHFTKDIIGCAMSARWADLAEVYAADDDYSVGTLVQFGGKHEVTLAVKDVNAVVSEKPGFVMNTNTNYEHPLPLALTGRVRVRVKGKVNKFDRLILSDEPGIAMVKKKIIDDDKQAIGVALEESSDVNEKLVLCSVQLKL